MPAPQRHAAIPERELRLAERAACARLAGLRDARGGLPINAAPPEAIAGSGSGGHASEHGKPQPFSPFRYLVVVFAALPFSPAGPWFSQVPSEDSRFGSIDGLEFSGRDWVRLRRSSERLYFVAGFAELAHQPRRVAPQQARSFQ